MQAPGEIDPLDFRINSKLMQNYKAEAPVDADGLVAASVDGDGNTIIIVRSDADNLRAIVADPSSGTGWRMVPIGVTTTAPATAGLGPDGSFTVMYASGSTIDFVEQNPVNRSWSAPRSIAFGAEANILALRYHLVAGTPYLVVGVAAADIASGACPMNVYYGPWTGAGTNLSTFAVLPQPVDTIEMALYRDDAGTVTAALTMTPQIYTTVSNNYQPEPVLTDGTPADQLGVWRAIPPAGCSILGDTAIAGPKAFEIPTDRGTVCVAAVDPPERSADAALLQRPARFVQTWHGPTAASIWTAEGPGATPLGHLGSPSSLPPDAADYVIVRNGLVVPGTDYYPKNPGIFPEQWNEYCFYRRFPLDYPLAVDAIYAIDSGGVTAATFFSHDDYVQPGPAYCLKSDTRQRSAIVLAAGGAFEPFNEANLPMVATSVVFNPSVRIPQFFGIGTDGALYSTALSGLNNWEQVQAGPYIACAASLDAKGRPEVFLIDEAHALWHIHLDDDRVHWTDPLQLAMGVELTQLITMRDDDGNSFAYAVAAGGVLYEIDQDPVSTEWNVGPVELPSTGQILEVWTYTSEIIGVDVAGAPLSNKPLTFHSDAITTATFNGRAHVLDRNSRLIVPMDGAGKLTITAQTTTLGGPVFYFTSDELPPGTQVEVNPRGGIESTLSKVSAPTLEKQFGIDTESATGAADAINNLMALGAGRGGPPRRPRFLRGTRDLRGARFMHEGDAPITALNPHALANQYFYITLGEEGPRFHPSTPEEIARMRAEINRTHRNIRDFEDWFDDVGDLVEEVWDEVCTRVEVYVAAAEQTFTFWYKDVQYKLDVALEGIEQVLAGVEIVLASIAEAFEELVDWLGFLFSWDDILATQQSIVWAVNQTLGFMEQAVDVLARNASDGIALARANLASGVDSLIANVLGPNGSLGELQARTAVPSAADAAAGTDIFSQPIADNSGFRGPRPAAGSLPSVLQELIDTITSEFSSIETGKAFGEALDFLANIGDKPDEFLQRGLAAVLKTLEGLADLALQSIGAIAQVICKALGTLIRFLHELMNEEWDIPVVTELYQTVARGPLTPLSLMSLVMAIPMTVISKAATGAMPIASSFTTVYTTEWLASVSGLNGEEARERARAMPEDARQVVGTAMNWITYAAGASYAALELELDIIPIGDPSPPLYSKLAIVAESLLWVAGLPWTDATDTAGISVTAGTWGFVNLMWAASFVVIAFDTLSYLAFSGMSRSTSTDFAVLEALYGSLTGLGTTAVSTSVMSGNSLVQGFGFGIPTPFHILRVSGDKRILAIVGALDFIGDFVGSIAALSEAIPPFRSPALRPNPA